MLEDQKIDCLQARPCSFQTERFTGCGSEGVNDARKTLSERNGVDETLSERNGEH